MELFFTSKVYIGLAHIYFIKGSSLYRIFISILSQTVKKPNPLDVTEELVILIRLWSLIMEKYLQHLALVKAGYEELS